MVTLIEVLNKVESTFPGLGETTRLVLAAATTTRFDRQLPLAIILVGEPSSGKTTLLMPLTRAVKGSHVANSILRTDEFSPASLVSHSANKKSEELEKIDLLPQLAGKCLVIKEMAPVFTGKEEDLARKFSVFASVLDGEGYCSNSGNHGRRGYVEPIVFTLIGAVTPLVLKGRVFDALAAIGPRFNFWDMPRREINIAEWRGPNEKKREAEKATKSVMIQFLEQVFSKFPSGSVPLGDIQLNEEAQSDLAAIAIMMAALRSQISIDDGGLTHISRESPERAFGYLEQVVKASALLEGRREVLQSDLRLGLGLAIGSSHPSRRQIMRIFMDVDRTRSLQDFMCRLEISDETATKHLKILSSLGVIRRVEEGKTYKWDLHPPYESLRQRLWLRATPFDSEFSSERPGSTSPQPPNNLVC